MAEDFNSGRPRTNPKLPERDSNPERPDCEFEALTTRPKLVRDLSKISRRGGGWEQREGHNFLRLQKRGGGGHEKWAVKRGRVMQIRVRDHVEVHPQKKKQVLYFVKKQPGRNRTVK